MSSVSDRSTTTICDCKTTKQCNAGKYWHSCICLLIADGISTKTCKTYAHDCTCGHPSGCKCIALQYQHFCTCNIEGKKCIASGHKCTCGYSFVKCIASSHICICSENSPDKCISTCHDCTCPTSTINCRQIQSNHTCCCGGPSGKCIAIYHCVSCKSEKQICSCSQYW